MSKKLQQFGQFKGVVSDDVCAELASVPAADPPCRNGGDCVNTFNAFECRCRPGWLGPSCDQPDHCRKSACPPGVDCMNSHGGFVCSSLFSFFKLIFRFLDF